MIMFITLLLWILLINANGFLASHSFQISQKQSRTVAIVCSATDKASDEDDDENDQESIPLRPEKSRMNDFVSQFLRKDQIPSDKDILEDLLASATHLIAIPMDTCHELLLELESVQRAILYHCPILSDACIPGAATRLPLLYVNAVGARSAQATQVLAETVQALVQKHIYDDESKGDDEDVLNGDGYRPLTMTFQSLEIDGSNNNVLNTVGFAGDDGTTKLQTFVQHLKTAVEQQGWQTSFPPDPAGNGQFRPRIPFMELPKSFDENLSRLKEEGFEIQEEDYEFLTSSEGGNGISPIFWCQWWDDVFGRNIRLKEIGIYPRSQTSDLSYSTFYMPYNAIALPQASSAMMRTELKFQKYQDDRAEEQQQQLGQAIDALAEIDDSKDDEDILLAKTQKRLEQVYIDSLGEENGFLQNDAVEGLVEDKIDSKTNNDDGIDEEEAEERLGDLVLGNQQEVSPDDFIDNWMKAKIRQAIESQESEKARKPVEKEMPPIADNPIFKAYKDGTLVPKSEQPQKDRQDPGPYPSIGHFVGIWKVVSSPTGFPVEESSNESSENLILRIDGTTAGGPILDPETRQKAAGGTWKIMEGDDGEVTLRIRLLIPPKRERVIEMIGQVNRISLGSQVAMASKAFGIPHLEALAKMPTSDTEEFMVCGGDVFVEDSITRKNRERVGEFSLTKIQGPKSSGDYTITIPKPI